MFKASSRFPHHEFHRQNQFDYPASVIGTRRAPQYEYVGSHSLRAASCVGGYYDEDTDSSDSPAYSIVSSATAPEIKLRRTVTDLMQRSQMVDNSGNFTLSLENNTMGEMIKAFMACQKCKEVSTKSKQLQCSHTICHRCAMQMKTRHMDPGQWMIRCLVCNLVTTWYGKNLDGLQDNITMQEMIKKTGNMPKHNKKLVKTKNGQITMYGEEDLTINIVSFAKEKAEIQKALESAERKIQLCQEQTKQVKDYEKRVNETKSKIRKQIKQSAEAYISAIRSQQAHMMDELEEMFKSDFQPIKEAKDAIEVQMQSLKLVTQCCCVASRILQSGGAPLDLENFKRMVWQTMRKTKAGKLPTVIQKSYKSNILFKSNESKYDEMAENIGELALRKQVRKQSVAKSEPVVVSETTDLPSSGDEEPIYDLPPDLEAKYARVNKKRIPFEMDECVYDEIPFFADTRGPEVSNMQVERPLSHTEIPSTHAPPPPLHKNNHEPLPDDFPTLPPPPPPTFFMNNAGSDTLNKAVEAFARRRKAINGNDSDSVAEDSFSSDSESDVEEKPIPKARSRRNSVRSRASGYRSGREMRSRPASPARSSVSRSKSFAGVENDVSDYYTDSMKHRYSSPISTGYETQPEHQPNGTISRILRRRSIKNINALSSHIQQLVGSSDTTLMGLDSAKLLFCVGKARKPGSSSNDIQQFNCPPEISISGDDTIWISDAYNHRIQIHEGVNGKLAGMFKTAIQGVALKPKGITTLSGGKKVAVSCGKYATVWTEGGELVRQIGPHSDFGKLGGMAADSNGNLILADVENSRIVITGSNKIVPDVAMGGGGSGKSPWQGRIAVNSFDQIICPDYGMHYIKIYSKTGAFVTKFGSFGVAPGQFRYPSAVAVDRQNRIYVADECNNRVSIFSADGEDFLGHVITKDDGLAFPHAISVFSDGAIAVADDSKVVKIYRGVDGN